MGRFSRLVAAVVAAGAVAVPAQAADVPGGATPPYDTGGQWAGCDPDTGACTADAIADPAAGRVALHLTASSAEGGAAPGHAAGQGDSWLGAAFVLAEPVPAVVFTARFRLDQATATADDPARSGAMAQLMLGAHHEGCVGSGCLAPATIEPLVDSGMTGVHDRSGEEVVLRVVLYNRAGGLLPAGTVWARPEIYGGVGVGSYQEATTGTAALHVDTVVTAIEASVGERPEEPPQSISLAQEYTGTTSGRLRAPCERRAGAVSPGAVCFDVPIGAVAAEVGVYDRVAPRPGAVARLDGGRTPFCGRSPEIALAGEHVLAVAVDAAHGALRCGGPAGVGSHGLVVATFTVRPPVGITPVPAR